MKYFWTAIITFFLTCFGWAVTLTIMEQSANVEQKFCQRIGYDAFLKMYEDKPVCCTLLPGSARSRCEIIAVDRAGMIFESRSTFLNKQQYDERQEKVRQGLLD